MSTEVFSTTGRTRVPRFGRLVGTEFRRLYYRRFVRAVALFAVLAFVAAVAAIFLQHGRVTAADRASADRKRDQQISEIRKAVQSCAQGVPAAQVEQQCGDVPTAAQFPSDQFLTRQPLQPDRMSDYALAVGAGVALLSFAVGATFVGAEWSSKNLVAWLFWEPRRLRLMAAKLLALLSVALAAALLAQLLWLIAAHLLLHYRGAPLATASAGANHFWRHLSDTQLRAALLVLPTSLLGFSMASLLRNTAAAFGIGFVYFAVLESIIRAVNPDWQPYLLTSNIGAWVSNHGLTVFGKQVYDVRLGYVAARPIHLSNLHGAVALIIYSGVLLVAALTVFLRSDIS